jgi:hypothetical protein
MKSNKARVPQVGEKLHFFDDGKVSDSRHYMAIVTHVLTPEQAKRMYVDKRAFCESHSIEFDCNSKLSLLDIHAEEVKNTDWLFADQTDYFIACSIPEFDDHIIWFVRTKDSHQSWFSMDIQSNWQGGYLDVDRERYQRMVDEGYTYSERI